jgi:integrase
MGTVADTNTEAIVRTGKLNVKQVQSIIAGRDAKPRRYYGDGGGLWLAVSKRDDAGKPVAASYVYRFMLDGKSREMGIGSAWDVKLAHARDTAKEYRERVKTHKVDVLDEKREADRQRREAKQLEAAHRMTFRQCAAALIRSREAGWRNDKHRWQWSNSLERFAYPVLGDLPVRDIDTAAVIKAIEPIWLSKTETASRTRGRIESVLDWARVRGFREGDNPARWKGHLEHLLPAKSKVAPVEHHAALPYAQIGAFIAELRQQEGIAARALEFAVLTAARSGEVIGMRWDERDLAERLWVVPPERMKAAKEHRVPLSDRALAILDEMEKIREFRPSKYVFQGLKDGAPLSNMALLMLLRRMGHPEMTVHGFRSTFSDWCAERSAFPAEVREMALAHAVSDKVEAAYRRGDVFEKRRQLAVAWERYIVTRQPPKGGNIVSIGAA